MLRELNGVLRDGSVPEGTTVPQLDPYVQAIEWNRCEDGTIRITVKTQDGELADLSGGAVIFAVRRHPTDEEPLISREADIEDPESGVADIEIVAADTVDLHDETEYHFSVEYIDSDGKRWQLVPWSAFTIEPTAYLPDEEVTVPVPAAPLALGPIGNGPQMIGPFRWDLPIAGQSHTQAGYHDAVGGVNWFPCPLAGRVVGVTMTTYLQEPIVGTLTAHVVRYSWTEEGVSYAEDVVLSGSVTDLVRQLAEALVFDRRDEIYVEVSASEDYEPGEDATEEEPDSLRIHLLIVWDGVMPDPGDEVPAE